MNIKVQSPNTNISTGISKCMNIYFDKVSISLRCVSNASLAPTPQARSEGWLVCQSVRLSDFHLVWVSEQSRSVHRDLWPFRHLIRVIRRHDLTKKNYLSTYLPTYLPTFLPTYIICSTYLPPLENTQKEWSEDLRPFTHLIEVIRRLYFSKCIFFKLYFSKLRIYQKLRFEVFCYPPTVLLGIFSFEEAPSLPGTVSKGHKCNPKQK